MKNQRKIILEILDIINKDSNKSIDTILNDYQGLSEQEYGFIKTVVYGTTRYLYTIDQIIKPLSKIKLKKIHPSVLNIIRMSLYQLIYMDHIPSHAVVNEGVNLAKEKSNNGAVSFVNGLLRNFIRNQDTYLDFSNKSYIERMALTYSFPIWLVKSIRDSYKDYNIEDILDNFNKESIFGIRANTLTNDKEILKNKLKTNGYKAEFMSYSKDGLIINNPNNIFKTSLFKDGDFYVQSESSQYVSELIMKYINGNRILDLCASPGGKITHIYEKLNGQGEFLACDINSNKVSLIQENLKRLKHKNIKTCVNNGEVLNEKFVDYYDLVIVDAPCSGLGLLRKYPNIKQDKTENTIKSLREIQYNILKNASKYVIKGGIISYSTCTFTKDENEDIIKQLLDEESQFTLEEFIRISPTDFNSDGFTIGIIKNNG